MIYRLDLSYKNIMYLKEKSEIHNLLLTIIKFVEKFETIENQEDIWRDCIDAINQICTKLQTEFVHNGVLSDIIFEKNLMEKMFENKSEIQCYLNKLLYNIEGIQAKIKVVFMPYKASMWDSLNSIYESAASDDMCEVKVIPLPYYELSKDENLLHCEINEFPKNIEMIDYRNYSLEEELPDIIFVHNIYDRFNTITRLPERYFTEQLKRYTKMLVYIPYHISSPYRNTNEEAGYAYMLPMKHVDKVVLCGKFVEEDAIKYGVPKNKILTLGSPKFDMIYNGINNNKTIPVEWDKKLNGKKTILLNTGCMEFVNDIRNASITLELVLDMVRYFDDVGLIWRPHPLARISLKKYAPQNLQIFDMYYNGMREDNYNIGTILDDSQDYLDAINASDILISGISSILDVYVLTQKPIWFLGDKMPQNSLLPPNAYYYFSDAKEPWCFFIKKFIKGYDPNKMVRKDLYKGIYENLDGSSGSKIYNEIKKELLRENI